MSFGLQDCAFSWTSDLVMKPYQGHIKTAKAQFVIGQVYVLKADESRSNARHRAYMAYVNQSWASLPDYLLKQYPSADHLRKRGLIECGYCTMNDHVCSSKAEAIRTAVLAASMDVYAVIQIIGCVVRIYRAESQSYKAMGKDRFNKSAEDVENWISGIIETAHEGRAA